ncbi:MAG: hypothetical protein AAF340_12585 [Pseudomonadota bacterium]
MFLTAEGMLPTLQSESDVEQKIILPLLTSPAPMGLELDNEGIYSKVSVKKLVIDKGKSRKNYFPDFSYVKFGLPLLIVEAKAPGEDLVEALREARLYAAELNSKFGNTVDPVTFVLASDGHQIIAGYANDAQPLFQLKASECSPSNEEFSKFQECFSEQSMVKRPNSYRRKSGQPAIGSLES